MILVAGRAHRVSAPGSDSCWMAVTPEEIPMTIKNATPVITATGHSQLGDCVVGVVVFVNGTPWVLGEECFANIAIGLATGWHGKDGRADGDGPQVQVVSFGQPILD